MLVGYCWVSLRRSSRGTYKHTTDTHRVSKNECYLCLHSPSYICAYCGKPAARSHLQASAASISGTQNKYVSKESCDLMTCPISSRHVPLETALAESHVFSTRDAVAQFCQWIPWPFFSQSTEMYSWLVEACNRRCVWCINKELTTPPHVSTWVGSRYVKFTRGQ
jgi:hypothetical protein